MERDSYGGPGVIIWQDIILNGQTELHVFDTSSVTGNYYCKEMILSRVGLSRGVIRPNFVFMDDDARPHWTAVVPQLLKNEDTTRMDCPAHYPDLNPIEHVWDALRRSLAARLQPPEIPNN
ncbi:transposable element Tcb2 transposase [Trichonephila clavipes]|nr:transposable element Tcb2 transposase [Trichonephila clavipes]